MTNQLERISDDQISQFKEQGYLLVKSFYSQEEVEELKDMMMRIHAGGRIEGYFEPLSEEEARGDILKMYPRILHPHKFNELALRYMVHPKVMNMLEKLFGDEPLGLETMLYYKPPGARGQALHQDNFYIRVEPGTCIAAWCAIDSADQDNGGLMVVPGTSEMEIVCPHEADLTKSFSNHEVDVPEGLEVLPIDMEAGDMLFFNGKIIHGSYPNTTTDRFRRAFIGHYIARSSERVGEWFNEKLYARDGSIVGIPGNDESGPCGMEAEPTFM